MPLALLDDDLALHCLSFLEPAALTTLTAASLRLRRFATSFPVPDTYTYPTLTPHLHTSRYVTTVEVASRFPAVVSPPVWGVRIELPYLRSPGSGRSFSK